MKVRKLAATTAILAAVGGTGAATAVAAQPATSAAPATQSQLREYEGRILSVNRDARTFRPRSESRRQKLSLRARTRMLSSAPGR